MTHAQIRIVSHAPALVVERVSAHVKMAFKADTAILIARLDLADAYDSARNQYHAGKTLELIEKAYDGMVLAIVEEDLFLPLFTHLFGLSRMKGRAAVVSACRLGAPGANVELAHERLIKEVAHETGHLFGLSHCLDGTCVMSSSSTVEEVDLKGAMLCESCYHRVAA